MATGQIDVNEKIETLKREMPDTYRLIRELAEDQTIGKSVYALVRRGLRGERSAFYAAERGKEAGTARFGKVPRMYWRPEMLMCLGVAA